ncbi:MAG: dTMP kinase [Candidatus Tectomicrobia bacterium]|nr:dTMP kinase [Candidatus Tectomicrobia bacterium]
MLIAFEGIDGAGKTTQARKLAENLTTQRFDVISLREPTSGIWGQKIRMMTSETRKAITPEEELDLFIKDRQEDVEQNIKPALAQKKIVIIDRYYFSSIAYQGALGIDPLEIQACNELFAPLPETVFLLDIAPEAGLMRVTQKRGDRTSSFEEEPYLKEVRKIFRSLKGPYIHLIDASLPFDTIQADLLDRALKVIKPYLC